MNVGSTQSEWQVFLAELIPWRWLENKGGMCHYGRVDSNSSVVGP